ncbi:MAG: Ig-like domain-containing protein [Deltaproteobacteria bacterium]|nr:Ig-like domain-containing protein [Deltaproteobacteria bacterium]
MRHVIWLLLAGGLACTGSEPATNDAVVSELRIRPASPVVSRGRRIQLVAEAMTADGFSYDQNSVVAWSVADESILAVDDIGIARGMSRGATTVTATHPDGPIASVDVEVLADDVESVRVAPTGPAVEVGDSIELTATATLQDGSEEDVTQQASWACNNLAAASVDDGENKGRVTGVEAGQATIAATFLGVRGTTSLTVSDGGER